MNRYSTLGARIVAAKGKVSRSLPAFLWNVALVPMLTFVWNYFFRLGFLDGREGLLLHLYHSAYVSWKYAKAWRIGGGGGGGLVPGQIGRGRERGAGVEGKTVRIGIGGSSWWR